MPHPFLSRLAPLFLLSLLFLPVAAAAQDCGCRSFPLAGSYPTPDGTLTVSYVDGTEDDCPTTIRLRAPRMEADAADVMLTCQGGVFRGIEPTRIGNFVWEARAAMPGPGAAPEGIGVGDLLEITLTPPAATGRGPRSLPALSPTDGRAPPCLCAEIRAERDFAADYSANFARPDLKALARSRGIQGSNNASNLSLGNDRHWTYSTSGGRGEQSYEDIVGQITQGTGTYSGGTLTLGEGPSTAQQAARAGVSGQMQSSSAAETNPITCKVRLRNPECTQSVMNEARIAHENVHAAQCERVNAWDRFTWIDGTEMTWPTNAMNVHDGYPLPPSPYQAWVNDIDNAAADEGAAYAAELPYYDAFLARYCPAP